MIDAENRDLAEHPSRVPFDATVERLVGAITAQGMTIFATIDHAAQARQVGLSLRPATVLLYGNPRGGTPVMIATPQAALDLPLRVLVREREDGTTMIAFHPIVVMLGRVGVPVDVAIQLEPAQRLLLAAVVT